MNNMNNEKNKSAVILNPERREWVSRSHVTSVESVVNDGAKTKRYSAKRDLYARSPKGSRLKMTEKALSLSGASSEKQKESSLILRKAKFQAIFKFVLSSASGGAGGGKYNRISAFVSMPVLLIRRSLEKFFKKNFRDDSSCFGFAKVLALALLFTLATTAESWANDTATQNEETPKILPDSGSCGNGCLYQITTDSTTGTRNLRVYNAPNYTGVANIANEAFAGKGEGTSGTYYEYHNNAVFDKITIDGDFDTIGENAFWRNGASEVVFNGNIKNIGSAAFEFNNLSSVNLPEGLQSIGEQGSHRNPISSVIIPDSVTEVNSWAFGTMRAGSYVYISDTLNSVGGNKTFGSGDAMDTISIICKGDVEKCERLVSNYSRDNYKTTESLSVTGVDKDHCTGEKYFWNGNICSRKESYCDKDMYYSGYECRMRPTDGTDITCDYDISGYVKVGNNCYSPEVTYAKKHYTPAEANQWLKDDDNFVVLTFKK